MADDFVLYRLSGQTPAPTAEQYKIYRYSQDGREVQVALDFGEIVSLDVVEEQEKSTNADVKAQLQPSRKTARPEKALDGSVR